MATAATGGRQLRVAIEQFALKKPFRICGHTMINAEVVTVSIAKRDCIGRGEASGVFYRLGEDPPSIMNQIEALRERIEAGLTRDSLQSLLPPGGARNALDCALWDFDARSTGRAAWGTAGLTRPRPLLTTYTVGADDANTMAADALAYVHAKAIKLKLTGQPEDAERVRAVRSVRPDVWLGVDANQGFTREFLETLMPVLVEAKVQLIEQPFRIGQDALIDGLNSPIPVAADESVQCLDDVSGLVGRYNIVNIKLDKCGGLTEGLAMAHEARLRGMKVMVGNMVGTSLAMAPSYLVGQLCDVVDLDGPIFLQSDRAPTVQYSEGKISCPEALWGGTGSAT